MHPILFEIPGTAITLHTYGALIVLGFFIGVYLLRRKARAEGLDPEKVTDIAFWALVLGLVGGRTLFVITRWEAEFSKDLTRIFKFWEGGLVYYGGFIAGVAVFYYLSKRFKFNRIQVMDMAAPSLAIAHAFGRFGCFAAGCCFGRQIDADHPFAVVFTDPHSIAPLGVAIHPAQLYDAVNALIIFTVLQITYKKRKFRGQVAATYLMIYAIGRTIVESYRGDQIRGFVIDNVLSTSQFISIFIFAAGIWTWFHFKKQASK